VHAIATLVAAALIALAVSPPIGLLLAVAAVQLNPAGAAAREQPGARAHQLRAIGATRDQRAENYPRWRSAV
jgi:hypothetical protein